MQRRRLKRDEKSVSIDDDSLCISNQSTIIATTVNRICIRTCQQQLIASLNNRTALHTRFDVFNSQLLDPANDIHVEYTSISINPWHLQ
jgi:hypothetical protein